MGALHFDIVIIGSGAGGGTMAYGAGRQRRATPAARARRLRAAAKRENWSPEPRSGSSCAIAPPSSGSTSAAPSSCRIRTTAWAGTPSSGAACSIACAREDFGEPRAPRRRVAGVADRLRHAGALLRPRRAAVRRARRGRRRSDRARRAGPSRIPAMPHAPRIGRARRAAAGRGPASVAAAAGAAAPRRARRLQLCNTCNSFPCQHARQERRRGVLRAARRSRAPASTLWTGARARRLSTNPSGSRVEAVEVERGGQVEQVGAGLVVVSCGAVNSAALLLQSATDRHPARPRQLARGWSAAATWRTSRR